MNKRRILDILRALEALEEINIFIKYAAASFPEESRQHLLLTYLLAILFDEQEVPEDMIIWQEAFKEAGFDAAKMAIIYLSIYKLLKMFLIEQELSLDDLLQKKLEIKSFKRLRLGELHGKALKELDKIIPDSEIRFHKEKSKRYYELYYGSNANTHHNPIMSNYLALGHQHERNRHAIVILRDYCEIFLRKWLFDIEPPKNIEEEYEIFLKWFCDRSLPIIDAFVLAAELLREPTAEKFYFFEKALFEYLPKLHSEKKTLVTLLINGLICIKDPSMDKDVLFFFLYKKGVERKLFIEKGRMSLSVFNNIVYIACLRKEYDWAEKFIRKHLKYLDCRKAQRANARCLYNCYLKFGKGQFKAVIKKLDKLKYEDFSYGTRKYKLVLKSWYELEKHNAVDAISTVGNSFMRYLRRKIQDKSIGTKQKRENLNFINFLNKLAKAPYSDDSKEKLLLSLDSYGKQIVEEKWLREKISEL